jgi:hypothetical protein
MRCYVWDHALARTIGEGDNQADALFNAANGKERPIFNKDRCSVFAAARDFGRLGDFMTNSRRVFTGAMVS